VRNTINPHGPSVRPFSRLPGRLAFCLKDAIPHAAIEAGHIFLGFSKCGQVEYADSSFIQLLNLGRGHELHRSIPTAACAEYRPVEF